jgi:outer membrane murein-binding lipoprotein Lpp
MKNVFAVALAATLVLAGCVSGRTFDASKVDQLSAGVSTEQDAIRLLGEPVSVVTNPQNQHRAFVWAYAYGTPIGGGGRGLTISFDADGRMIQVIQQTKL